MIVLYYDRIVIPLSLRRKVLSIFLLTKECQLWNVELEQPFFGQA